MKLYVATVRIAIDAEACGNTVDGACEWISGLLSENTNVFDWAYHGSHKGSFPKPRLTEIKNPEYYEEGDLFK